MESRGHLSYAPFESLLAEPEWRFRRRRSIPQILLVPIPIHRQIIT
jgi:hypothetical protein